MMNSLQMILLTTLLAVLLCSAVLSLVSAVQTVIYNRRHEKRDKEKALLEVEYYHKRLKG